MTDGKPRARSRVPRGRLERLARIGWMAGEFAAGGVAEGARRLVRSTPEDAANAFLTVANARRLARRLSRMRGAAMKLGQLLSLEGEDLLPPEFVEALAVLRSAADAMPASQVRRALGREYGKGWESRFQRFDFEPLAAASIGQVHEATAADGRELALKIQYPGVARSIDSDVDNLATMLRLTRILPVGIDVSGIIAEAKRQLRAEADYHAEADNLRRYAALLEGDPELIVPAVHDDFTTKRILAMELIRGRPFDDLRGAEHPQALRNAVGATLQRLMFRELFEFRFMQTDPNFANYLFLPEARKVALLDFGATREIPDALAQLYRRLFGAALARDRRALRAVAVEIGFTADDERPERIEGLLDLILLVCEPLRHRGVYDFGASDLAVRARDAGFELAFGRGFLNAPPPETMFLHRKLAGTFFLCARIRARVDARSILEPFLTGTPTEPREDGPGSAAGVNPRPT
ncbi:MAG: AarF/ABC1/UbiB kinase family protein [Deltaproteobacteria bacterium]|nr:MAG: AarF/ABC1/UbiB kinase family protein [Deltaproteobacteria bacterium]